ncbi:Non-specific serine/threonine protein kinase [Bertholletia excelsa]
MKMVKLQRHSDYGEGNDILRFLRLDNDGNLRIYSSARGSGRTNVSWVAVSDQCKVFGYCGNMGICSYKGLSPICECASKNFDPVDPTDGRKGCKRKMELEECPQSQIMLQLNHTLFLTYPPELSNQSQLFYGNLIACMSNCLLSPPCTASTALGDNSGTIFMKLSNFAGGYRSPALPSTSFVKICGPAIPNPPFSSLGARASRLPAWNVGVVVVGTIVCFIALQGGLIWWCCYRRRNGKLRGRSVALLKYGSGRTVEFSYKDLQYVTKGFKEKLGAGEFGAAYRGALASGTTVAVKQLEGIKQGERQFRREITSLICTHHLNLVRLIGFCAEGRHRILVYEFMKNGSLENSLFTTEEEKSRKWLNWGQRFNIAIGTARAITYLHEECEHRILHYDIKPGNILLDEHYNPIVSDFCLAELINPINRCQKLTNSAGSRGYVAPEWLENMQMTSKSDVYSFGMVLLEIVSGRRSYQVSHETNGKTVSLWAYEEFEKGNAKGIMDRRIADCEELDMEQVRRVIQVSFWCIQREPCRRPTMGKVVQMLEGVSKIEKPPAPHVSSNIRASSLLGDPTMATSSSFSFQTRRGLSVGSARNPEREDSFVL